MARSGLLDHREPRGAASGVYVTERDAIVAHPRLGRSIRVGDNHGWFLFSRDKSSIDDRPAALSDAVGAGSERRRLPRAEARYRPGPEEISEKVATLVAGFHCASASRGVVMSGRGREQWIHVEIGEEQPCESVDEGRALSDGRDRGISRSREILYRMVPHSTISKTRRLCQTLGNVQGASVPNSLQVGATVLAAFLASGLGRRGGGERSRSHRH
jgi:hypothetical protein